MTTGGDHMLEELLKESARGNTTSFKELYELLADRIFAYVRSRAPVRDDAIDITQQTFIELWKSLPRFMYQSDAAFYGFVFTIAKRQLVRAYRKTDDTVHLEHEEDFPHETAHTTDEDTVARALTTLDDISREIIVLHHWSRYTFKEIADMFGMNENAVRVRHHRALGTLRTTLEKAMKYEK